MALNIYITIRKHTNFQSPLVKLCYCSIDTHEKYKPLYANYV